MEAQEREVRVLFPDEAKAFLDSTPDETYTLLDVRQPFEYEQTHLPGARLIPLPVLADSLKSINPHQPVLVYCAVGGRSRGLPSCCRTRDLKESINFRGASTPGRRPPLPDRWHFICNM